MQSSKFDNDTWYQWKYGAIKKLYGTNYEDWLSVQSALTVVDAFEIVTGGEQQPPAANSATAKAATDSYRKRRALAAHLLKRACMPNVQIHVRGLVDPKEIWDTYSDGLTSLPLKLEGRPFSPDFSIPVHNQERKSATTLQGYKPTKPNCTEPCQWE